MKPCRFQIASVKTVPMATRKSSSLECQLAHIIFVLFKFIFDFASLVRKQYWELRSVAIRLKTLRQVVCEFELDQSERKLTQLYCTRFNFLLVNLWINPERITFVIRMKAAWKYFHVELFVCLLESKIWRDDLPVFFLRTNTQILEQMGKVYFPLHEYTVINP